MNTNNLPTADEAVDADPTVAELEQRIANGDATVTPAQLLKARTDAAGRTRFEQLRGVAADRAAVKHAEEVEREQAAAAEQHARETLAAHGPAELVAKYDAAVDALRALAAGLDDRNDVLMGLIRLPAAERVRGAQLDPGMQSGGPRLPLDGTTHRPQQADEVLPQVLGAARILQLGSNRLRVVGEGEHVHIDGDDPRFIAEARAQLEAPANGDAA